MTQNLSLQQLVATLRALNARLASMSAEESDPDRRRLFSQVRREVRAVGEALESHLRGLGRGDGP